VSGTGDRGLGGDRHDRRLGRRRGLGGALALGGEPLLGEHLAGGFRGVGFRWRVL